MGGVPESCSDGQGAESGDVGAAWPPSVVGAGWGVSFVSLNERENKQGHRGPGRGRRLFRPVFTASSLTAGAASSGNAQPPRKLACRFWARPEGIPSENFLGVQITVAGAEARALPQGAQASMGAGAGCGIFISGASVRGGRGSARTLGGPHTRGGKAVLGGQRGSRG